jgi:hypothetical protein
VTVVADAAGPKTDLGAGDFVVREGNTTHEVLGAALVAEPLFIEILVDTSQSPRMPATVAQDLRSALAGFVKTVRAAAPDAQVALMEVAGAAVERAGFGAEPAALDKAIGRLYPNMQSGAVIVEALSAAAKTLSTRPTPRRAIVAIDFNSQETSSDRSVKSVGQDVLKSGVTVWSVSVRGPGGSASNRESVLNQVTSIGGLRLSALETSGLAGMLTQVAHSLLSQYSVTFARADQGPVKSIKMETKTGGKVLVSPWMR